MKKVLMAIVVATSLLAGCAITPYKDLNLDTTSNFKTPTESKSGIYVYQWKRGIIGSLFDVDFEIKGLPEVSLNTGEYCYFEAAPGKYEYKISGFIFNQYAPVEFAANENYFFRAMLMNSSDHAYLVRDQEEIDEAKKNILTERYELCTKD